MSKKGYFIWNNGTVRFVEDLNGPYTVTFT